ncbi:MAG: hypothetical protein HQL67_07395 [Magnetococcales bacterium]|nr:hypothetical protein [Magnetococcales bacterium]
MRLTCSIKWVFLLGCLPFILLTVASPGHSQGAIEHQLPPTFDPNLKGPEFSDPSLSMSKSKAWQQTPVSYDYWAKDADIAITLDQHLYPALSPLLNGFAKERGIRIAVKEGTCGVSQGLLNRKRVDMAGFCCPPALTDRLPGLAFHTLAISALAIIVNHTNPIDNLSVVQIQSLFRGTIADWQDISTTGVTDQTDQSVWVVGRLHCKIRPGHWRLILDHEDLFSPQMDEAGNIPNMIHKVSRYTNAIGYEVLWDIQQYGGHPSRVKVVSVDGVSPARSDQVIQGRYPFYRTHSLAIWENEAQTNPHAQALLEFIKERISELSQSYSLIPAEQLRKAGWQFQGDELIGGLP